MKRILFITLFIVTFGILKSKGVFSSISLDNLQNLREWILNFGMARLRPNGLHRGSLHSPRCSERRLVEAAGVEP